MRSSFETTHQQPQDRHLKKFAVREKRRSRRSTTSRLEHCGHSVRAKAINAHLVATKRSLRSCVTAGIDIDGVRVLRIIRTPHVSRVPFAAAHAYSKRHRSYSRPSGRWGRIRRSLPERNADLRDVRLIRRHSSDAIQPRLAPSAGRASSPGACAVAHDNRSMLSIAEREDPVLKPQPLRELVLQRRRRS